MLQTAKVQVPYILDLGKVICSITNEAIVTVVAVLEVYLDRVLALRRCSMSESLARVFSSSASAQAMAASWDSVLFPIVIECLLALDQSRCCNGGI